MRRTPLGYIVPFEMEHRVKYPAQEIPVESVATNEDFVIIGKTINSFPEQPVKLYKNTLYRHVLVVGTTGSGKSFTASIIANRVARHLEIPTVIIDWHGEYQRLLDDHRAINPFEKPLELFTGDPSDLSIISSVFELTPPQEYLLEKVIRKVDLTRLKSIEAFIDYLEAYPEESSWMRETKLSLHRKLHILTRYGHELLFKLYSNGERSNLGVRSDARVPAVVDVGRIPDLNVRKLYSALYIKRAVDIAISSRSPLLVILEEAQNYLSRNHPVKPICDMLREVRKFQVGLVVISQSVSQLIDDVLTNTNTKIVHAIKSKVDLDVIEKSLYLESNIMAVVPYLEPGEAVYSAPVLKKAVLVKIE